MNSSKQFLHALVWSIYSFKITDIKVHLQLWWVGTSLPPNQDLPDELRQLGCKIKLYLTAKQNIQAYIQNTFTGVYDYVQFRNNRETQTSPLPPWTKKETQKGASATLSPDGKPARSHLLPRQSRLLEELERSEEQQIEPVPQNQEE